jgi:sorting nexin-9/18/33
MDMPSIGASFYAHVYHPSYTLEPDECNEGAERFAQHVSALESSMRWLREVFGKVRSSRARKF